MKKNTKENYFELLKEIHHKISQGEQIRLQKYLISAGFSSTVSSVMLTGNIIKNEGSKKVPKYVWTTCLPNIKMAEELEKRVDSHTYKVAKKSVEKHRKPSGDFVDIRNAFPQTPGVLNEEEAVKFLKDLGYKLMKPITQWEEV